jgi:hypothetical protein
MELQGLEKKVMRQCNEFESDIVGNKDALSTYMRKW